MANFHFYLGNHEATGRRSLYDLISYISKGLSFNGHTTSKSAVSVCPLSINLLFENFRQGHGDELEKASITFGIIATEFFDGVNLNFQTSLAWRLRLNGLKEVAPKAEFIWCMYEDSVPYYAKFSNSYHLRLGFLGQTKPVGRRPLKVSFLGKVTPYRKKRLDGLRNAGVDIFYPEKFLDNYRYLKKVGASRLILCIRQSPEWELPSYARVSRALSSGCGVLSDTFNVSDYFTDYIFTIDRKCDSKSVRGLIESISDEDIQRKLTAFRSECDLRGIWSDVLSSTKMSTQNKVTTIKNSSTKRMRLRLDFYFEWFTLNLIENRETLRTSCNDCIDRLLEEGQFDSIWGLGSVDKILDLSGRLGANVRAFFDRKFESLNRYDSYNFKVHSPKELRKWSKVGVLVTFPRRYASGLAKYTGNCFYIEDIIYDSIMKQGLDVTHREYFNFLRSSMTRRKHLGVSLKNSVL